MLRPDPKQVIEFLNHLYMRLLIICPPSFRQTYATEIAQLLHDYGRDVYQKRGIVGFLVYWLRAVGDLLLTALYEQWECFAAGNVQRRRLYDLDNALLYFEKLRAVAEDKGYQRYRSEALIGLGLVYERRAENITALAHYRRALDLAGQIGFQRVVAAATTLIGQLALVAG